MIDQVKGWRAYHTGQRDRYEPKAAQRRDHGLEALSCAIRQKALEDCLAIVLKAWRIT